MSGGLSWSWQVKQRAVVSRAAYCAEFVCTIPFMPFHRYNTVMKLVFLGTSCAIVYYMRYHRIIRLTYDKDQDTFRHWMLIAPSAALALIFAHPRSFLEVRLSGLTIGTHQQLATKRHTHVHHSNSSSI